MFARIKRAYHCEACDFELRYEWRATEFGRRLVLWHEPSPIGCKFSDKVFYIPRLEITEFPAESLKSS